MNAAWWLGNLAAYSVQVALVVAVGAKAGQKRSATAHGYFLSGKRMP